MVEVDGVSLAVTRTGTGPPVLCLHATGHGARDFEAFGALVGKQFEVIAVDWPGQGRSGDDTHPASAARYAQLIGGVLDAIGVDRAILLGCSIGGAAAIMFAQKHPDRVRGLVLCNPGGLIELDPGTVKAIGYMVRFFAAGERGTGWFGSAFAAYYRLLVLPSRAARAQRRRIAAAGYACAPVLRQAWESFAQPDADIRGVALSLQVPIWFAWAKGDKFVSLKRSRATIDKMPTAQLTTFRGGHAAFLERPKRFAKAFCKFADQLPPA
ncbi:alpha/beta hydrolase [Pyruvatibacter sp.]|uniref:alpha/beta fold hydrolase n=1 Tax=Pyruvatibacter sp. TaxID=1981328 RepID=UPI0032657F22